MAQDTKPQTKDTKPEAKIDPVVEKQEAQDARPFIGGDYRTPRQQRIRPLTHAAGPQPEEVEKEIAKTTLETGDSRAEAEIQVRAEREAKERQKRVERLEADLKKRKETEDEVKKQIDARQEELKEKKTEADLKKKKETEDESKKTSDK